MYRIIDRTVECSVAPLKCTYMYMTTYMWFAPNTDWQIITRVQIKYSHLKNKVALYVHHFLFNRKQLPPPVGQQVTPPLMTSPPTTKIHQPISLRSYLLLLICQQFTTTTKKKITRVCQTTPSALVGISILQCMTLSQTPCGYLEGERAQGDFVTPG